MKPANSPSHSLNVQHLEQLHYKSRENDYSPRSLVLPTTTTTTTNSQKPPEYHETSCQRNRLATTQTDSTLNANITSTKLPGSGIRNPHYKMGQSNSITNSNSNSNTHLKYTSQKSPTNKDCITTINFDSKQEIKPMKTNHQLNLQTNSKAANATATNQRCSSISNRLGNDVTFSQQRTLINLFQLYVIIVIILALVYAIYQFSIKTTLSAQNNHNQLQQSSDPLLSLESNKQQQQISLENFLELTNAKQSEMEQKLQLMQKYIELMANDLQDTKERLREREKCHCSRPCTSSLNMTQQYPDGATWQQQCDICSCQVSLLQCN